MKKRKFYFRALSVFLLIALVGLVGCGKEDKAKQSAESFVRQYYAQYTQGDEIREIYEAGAKGDEAKTKKFLQEYVEQYFGDMLTEKGKDICVRNRYIPLFTVLHEEVENFELQKLTLSLRNQESEYKTYDFEAHIQYDKEGEKTERTEEGTIVLEKEGIRIDYFDVKP